MQYFYKLQTDCHIRSKGAKKICEVLEKNSSLTALNLKGNKRNRKMPLSIISEKNYYYNNEQKTV